MWLSVWLPRRHPSPEAWDQDTEETPTVTSGCCDNNSQQLGVAWLQGTLPGTVQRGTKLLGCVQLTTGISTDCSGPSVRVCVCIRMLMCDVKHTCCVCLYVCAHAGVHTHVWYVYDVCSICVCMHVTCAECVLCVHVHVSLCVGGYARKYNLAPPWHVTPGMLHGGAVATFRPLFHELLPGTCRCPHCTRGEGTAGTEQAKVL